MTVLLSADLMPPQHPGHRYEIEQARQAYRELGKAFLVFAECMDAALVESIQEGLARLFWEEELRRVLWPLEKQHLEVRDGENSK